MEIKTAKNSPRSLRFVCFLITSDRGSSIHAPRKTITFIFRLNLLLLCIQSAKIFAQGAKGPSVSSSWSSDALIKTEADTWEDGQDDLTYHLDKQKHTADLLIPLSQKFGSLLLADINATKEKRIYSSKNSPLPSSNYTRFSNLSALKLGLIYLPPKTSKDTQYFVLLSRYGRFDFDEDIRPMVESIVGFDLSLQKYGIQLPKTHSNYGRFLTRVRNYAYGNEYLVIVEYQFKIGDSLAFEISIPSHLKAEWLTKNKQWGIYLIASGSSYQYPLNYDDTQGWLKGATLQAYLGLRKHLISIFHVSAEGGAQMEEAEYYDEKKNLLRRHTTNPSPWLRLQLETYIP